MKLQRTSYTLSYYHDDEEFFRVFRRKSTVFLCTGPAAYDIRPRSSLSEKKWWSFSLALWSLTKP